MDRPGDKPDRYALPEQLVSVLWPALQSQKRRDPRHYYQYHSIARVIIRMIPWLISLMAGMSGLLFGGVAGILKSSTPTLFAIASGIQWFTLGSTYWAARGIVLNAQGREKINPFTTIAASTIAGGMAGFAGGLLRGRRNVIPGALVFAMLGGAGQTIHNMADSRHVVKSKSPGEPQTRSRWLDSKWSPVKVLSDDEYEGILQEKLLRVKAEIALIDENIVELQKNATQKKAPQTIPDEK